MTFGCKCVDRICNLREGADVFDDSRWARYVIEAQTYVLPLAVDVPSDWLYSELQTAMTKRKISPHQNSK